MYKLSNIMAVILTGIVFVTLAGLIFGKHYTLGQYLSQVLAFGAGYFITYFITSVCFGET